MWFSNLLTRLMGAPREETERDMAWLRRIPPASPPPGYSSLFGTHIATNKAECPFRFLARPEMPDTVRLDHGIMRGSTPDAVYTKDPVLTRSVLQNRANPKAPGWYRFHHRIFNYAVPRDLLTYSNADDPMVATLRQAVTAGLADAFERHEDQIAVHMRRWVDEVARGPVEVSRATRRLTAEIVHLVAFGELPKDRWFTYGYQNVDPVVLDSKRRLAHLLWPVLDRLPTPYALMHRASAVIFRRLLTDRFNQYRHNSESLVGWLDRYGAAEGHPNLAWETLPFIVNAAIGILPYPMVMSLYVLADKPELQQRIVDDDLYGAALKETLRLHPAVPTIARVVTQRVESESAVIEQMASPEGQLYMNPMGILRHPRGWSRPDDFIIDRWLPGWHDDADPDYRLYIPFGMGARSCIGAAFATKVLELFLRVVLSARTVSNPSGRPPRVAEGSLALVRRPFTLAFAERPGRVPRAGTPTAH